MATLTTPDAPATAKQLAYIQDLIFRNGAHYRQIVRDIEHRTPDLDSPEVRQRKAERDAAAVLVGLWGVVTLPTERLTQKSASAVIERLKGAIARGLAGDWLDNPQMARTYGVAGYIEANRDAIERAIKRA